MSRFTRVYEYWRGCDASFSQCAIIEASVFWCWWIFKLHWATTCVIVRDLKLLSNLHHLIKHFLYFLRVFLTWLEASSSWTFLFFLHLIQRSPLFSGASPRDQVTDRVVFPNEHPWKTHLNKKKGRKNLSQRHVCTYKSLLFLKRPLVQVTKQTVPRKISKFEEFTQGDVLLDSMKCARIRPSICFEHYKRRTRYLRRCRVEINMINGRHFYKNATFSRHKKARWHLWPHTDTIVRKLLLM